MIQPNHLGWSSNCELLPTTIRAPLPSTFFVPFPGLPPSSGMICFLLSCRPNAFTSLGDPLNWNLSHKALQYLSPLLTGPCLASPSEGDGNPAQHHAFPQTQNNLPITYHHLLPCITFYMDRYLFYQAVDSLGKELCLAYSRSSAGQMLSEYQLSLSTHHYRTVWVFSFSMGEDTGTLKDTKRGLLIKSSCLIRICVQFCTIEEYIFWH